METSQRKQRMSNVPEIHFSQPNFRPFFSKNTNAIHLLSPQALRTIHMNTSRVFEFKKGSQKLKNPTPTTKFSLAQKNRRLAAPSCRPQNNDCSHRHPPRQGLFPHSTKMRRNSSASAVLLKYRQQTTSVSRQNPKKRIRNEGRGKSPPPEPFNFATAFVLQASSLVSNRRQQIDLRRLPSGSPCRRQSHHKTADDAQPEQPCVYRKRHVVSQ
jgi:hypothetical protein